MRERESLAKQKPGTKRDIQVACYYTDYRESYTLSMKTFAENTDNFDVYITW